MWKNAILFTYYLHYFESLAKFFRFLLDLKNEGKTIIISTHIFSLVEKICDRVGIIFNGKMIVEDSVKELTSTCSLEDKCSQ